MTKQKLFESIFILVVFMISLYGRKLLHAYVPMELSGSVLRVAYIYAW